MALTRKRADERPGRNPQGETVRPFRVLALDPGGTTGWATSEWRPDYPDETPLPQPSKLSHYDFDSGQIGPHEHHNELWKFLYYQFELSEGVNFAIVCESFEFRQHISKEHAKTKVELISKEYIGLVKLFCTLTGVPLVFNTASAAKSLCPDKGPEANVKLKQLGLYTPANPHSNDATRHLLRFLFVTLKIKEPFASIWLGETRV